MMAITSKNPIKGVIIVGSTINGVIYEVFGHRKTLEEPFKNCGCHYG